MALEACSDTWLLAVWDLAVAGSVQLSDRKLEESGDHDGGQSYPPWLSGICWWPLALLLACWWLFTTHIPLALPAALAKAISGFAEDL